MDVFSPDVSTYDSYMRRFGALDTQYASWKTRQHEIIRHISPYRGRFELDEQITGGQRKDQFIVNDTAADALKKLVAALVTSISPMSRRWFRMRSAIAALHDNPEVKQYLRDWEDVLFGIFGKSNIYKLLPQLYADLGGPGTCLGFLETDTETVLHGIHAPVGSYRIACNAKGEVDTAFHRFAYTVRQVAMAFCMRNGKVDEQLMRKRCSQRTFNAYQTKKYDEWVNMLHVVEPRATRQYGKIDKLNKPWASCWMEWTGITTTGMQSGGLPTELLREDGFDEQPFVCGRWDVIGEDSYGSESPGMLAIGDVKGLQALERSSATMLATGGDPALNLPHGIDTASIIPGRRNRLPQGSTTGAKVEATYVPDVRWYLETRNEKQLYEQRIERAFYADLVLLLSNDESAQKDTAEAVREKKDERLLQLAGMFERTSSEVLTHIVNRAYVEAQKQRLGPRPPDVLIHAALAGRKTVDIEYENILSQAQKSIGMGAVQQWVGGLIQMSTSMGSPEAIDSINVREIATGTGDMLGISPKFIATDDEVQQKQQARAQQQQAQQQMEAAKVAAPAAKAASQIDPEQLRQVLAQFGPNAVAQGTGVA